MGLLDNLRKRAAEASDETEGADSDTAADDGWLVGVERRKPEFETASAAEPAPLESGAGLEESVETEMGSPEEPPATESNVPQSVPATLRDSATFPDLGMVYAGLEETGIAPFQSENQVDSESGTSPLSAFPSIEAGPIGPEALVHLTTLGLSVGCTWDDVTQARRRILESLTEGTAEEWNQRAEVNHAFASLRLLRVGSLKY